MSHRPEGALGSPGAARLLHPLRQPATLFLVLAIAGCAAPSARSSSAVGPDHPASAQAQEAPLPGISGSLEQGGASPSAQGDPVASHEHGEPAQKPTRYACPMHPEVVSASPGECPICGMDLEPAAAEGAQKTDHAQDHPHDHR
jgi:hypothetical protein